MPKFQSFLKLFFFVIFFLGVVGFFLFGIVLPSWKIRSSFMEEIKAWKPRSSTLILDNLGNRLHEVYGKHQIYYPQDRFSSSLIQAVVAIEDRQFWEHRGVDPLGLFRAFLKDFQRGKYVQGGSTITQQLVRHMLNRREKTLSRKILEIFLALELEQRISKEKILEIYLNDIFLGHGAYGLGAASERYFGKPLHLLKLHEESLLVGLFQSPSSFNPYQSPKKAKQRQELVIKSMVAAGYLTQKEALFWSQEPLAYVNSKPKRLAPYFCDYITKEAEKILGYPIKDQGLEIHTTLDASLQKASELILQKQSIPWKSLESENPLQSAILVTNPQDGDVLTMIGGRDYRLSSFNRVTQAFRQPGSAFKPVLYSLALNQGYKWNNRFLLSPLSLQGYSPRLSFDLNEVSMLKAFYKSMNGPALELANALGVDAIRSHAKQLGIETPLKKELGIALGSSEVTMMDLAKMNGVFASFGVKTSLGGIKKIFFRNSKKLLYKRPSVVHRSERVLSPQESYLMVEGMKNVLQRGTGKTLASHLGSWTGGKSGTSNQSRDNWFTGFSSNRVVVVWVGSDRGFPSLPPQTLGSTLALPIWTQIMELSPKTSFPVPQGLVSSLMDPQSGFPSSDGIPMWFLKADEAAAALSKEGWESRFPYGT